MAAAKKTTANASIDVMKVERGRVSFCVLGDTPIILNRMSEKAMHELLIPKGRKTAADKAGSLKHNPMAEFAASPYTDPNPDAPTYITHLGTAFKGSIKSAALDIPGANKSQVGRLTWVEGERVAIYGVPKILLSVTRSADMNRTPDVRTRAIIPNWAAIISVNFVMPNLNEQTVGNLLSSAGLIQGVGDWRPGKGSGTYGQFSLVSEDDPAFQHIIKHGGRAAQIAAMDSPEPYDQETRELLSHFTSEINRRGLKAVA